MSDPAARAPQRVVLHLDMDAFFASVEQRDRPELRGRPVLVAWDRPRSIVTTASYEARPFGCRSAQPVAVAKRLCPHAVIVPPRFEAYAEASDAVMSMLKELSPLVEPLSIDEAFVDLTGTERLLGAAPDVAERVRRRIRDELRLTASCGVAPNKFLAKLASDLRKPDGLTVVRPGDESAVLDPLPVERLWGVGPKSGEELRRLGIPTIGALRAFGDDRLAALLGPSARHWAALARGEDDRPVVAGAEAKSIGREQTFEEDLGDAAEVRAVLLAQAEDVGRRLRRQRLAARGVSLKIRYGAFETITRQTTLEEATDATADLWAAASRVWDLWASASFRPVRLVGVTATRLERGGGGTLFGAADRERRRALDSALDAIDARFGAGAVRRAGGRAVPSRTDAPGVRRRADTP